MKSSKQPLQPKSGKDSISNVPVQKREKQNIFGLTQEGGSYQKMANTSGKVMNQASVQLMAEAWTDQHGASYKDFRPEKKNGTAPILQRKANTTGLPDQLKTGAENLSGYSLNDVKVHYNSPRPAQLQAHAFAQGTDIHVAPGQEKHLPHETWHVVQQKQGRVKPTVQLQRGVAVNDDKHLESEADKMGEKAFQAKNPVLSGATLKKGDKSTQQKVQLKPAVVNGLTHIVEKKGNSIYNGREIDEVSHGNILDVDPHKRIRSRRGPNQELVGDYDKRGEHIYRWFHVNSTPVLGNISGREGYIREDTFTFKDIKDVPKVNALVGRDIKRERQSHVAVKFEVWYNDNYFRPQDENVPLRNLDRTGHMVMKDYARGNYMAYEMGDGDQVVHPVSEEHSEKVEEHSDKGIKVKGAGPFSTYKALDARREDQGSIHGRLRSQERVMGVSGGIKPKQQGEERQRHRRFNKRKWAEVLVSMEEYKMLNRLFEARRTQGGFYCFYLEARTELDYALATRCLSVMEDIALRRGMEVGTGHAKELIDKFIELSGITASHFDEEEV